MRGCSDEDAWAFARELGIQRFGLKHDKVIQERGGQALPIPVQERFRSTDLFLTLLQVAPVHWAD